MTDEFAHVGTLLSGEVVCKCGWSSGHLAHADDANEMFARHLEEQEDD